MFDKITQKMGRIKRGHLLLYGVAVSVTVTMAIVSVMSFLFHGKITYDLMITGIITSFLVSLVVIYALLSLFKQLKETHEKMVQAEYYYRTLFESIKDCVCIISEDGNFIDVNNTMCEINGYASPSEVIGRHFLNRVIENSAELSNAFKRALKGETVHVEYKSITKNGNEIWWDSVFTPIKETDGTIKSVLRISRDITERKKTDERLAYMLHNLEKTKAASLNIMEDLRHEIFEHRKTEALLKDKTARLEELTEKLELQVKKEVQKRLENEQLLIHQSRLAAMGEMIGAIAHQWRQPLNAVGLIIQDMKDAYKYGELSEEYLDKNVKQGMKIIKKMSKTIDDFRNFFKPDKEKVRFDVKDAIKDALSIVDAQLKAHNIPFKVTCHAHNKTFDTSDGIIACGEHEITGYKNEFEHVLLNLINNAKDALETVQEAKRIIDIDIDKDGSKVIITVRDNAGGIPEEIIDKIFDPYFTTKEQGKGTGIGLYMAKTIIERNMGGSLTVRNINGGAEFRIEV